MLNYLINMLYVTVLYIYKNEVDFLKQKSIIHLSSSLLGPLNAFQNLEEEKKHWINDILCINLKKKCL